MNLQKSDRQMDRDMWLHEYRKMRGAGTDRRGRSMSNRQMRFRLGKTADMRYYSVAMAISGKPSV